MDISRASNGYVDPNRPPDLNNPNDAPIIIYGYVPSFALTIAAAAIFGLSFLVHSFQLIRYKTWYFTTVPIALALEIVGYIFRSFSAHKDPYSVLYFVLQYFFIVTAPVFLSAAIYAVLSVLITRVGRQYSPIPPKWVLGIFITSDVVATIVQILGAALIGSAESNNKDPTKAKNILMAGLIFQVVTFFIFLSLTARFLQKASKVVWETRDRRLFLLSFIAATILVYLRTCFRLAEIAEGVNGFLFSHEKYFAGLEFAPIAAAVLLFNIWHPGRCLKKD